LGNIATLMDVQEILKMVNLYTKPASNWENCYKSFYTTGGSNLTHPLEQFDSFDGISNEDLFAVYLETLRDQDPDLPWIEKECEKRGLLGRC